MTSFKPVQDITQFAEIFQPNEAEQPILSPEIRLAIRQWLVEINAEEELKSHGLKPRRNAILSGPPGCGKTTLAQHFAARLGLPLVLVNMGSLLSSYFGASAQNVNKLFNALQEQSSNCVLFLDEFDSLAVKRSSAHGGGDQERNGIVIALLQKIDSFPGTIIAATNRGDDIDPAIWRRFGMHLEIKEPDDECRFAILARYLLPFQLPTKAMDMLTEITVGASPAVLKQLMEGIKRDLILAPRYNQSITAEAVFSRLIASVKPHADTILPPLWKEKWPMEEIKKMAWPPEVPTKNSNSEEK